MEEKDPRGRDPDKAGAGFKVVCWACCLVGPPALPPFAAVLWYIVHPVSSKNLGDERYIVVLCSHGQRPSGRSLVGQGCFAVGRKLRGDHLSYIVP